MFAREFNFSPQELIYALVLFHDSLHGHECSDADPSIVETDSFLLWYKIFTAVKAILKITRLLLLLFPSTCFVKWEDLYFSFPAPEHGL